MVENALSKKRKENPDITQPIAAFFNQHLYH